MITVTFPAFFTWLFVVVLLLAGINECLKIYLWYLKKKIEWLQRKPK